jgi:hypothetical protein
VLSISVNALITFSLRGISSLLRLFGTTFFLTIYPKVLPRSKKSVPLFNTSVKKPHILLTGGASCPDGIIQQVISRINSFFQPDEIRAIGDVLEAFRSET